MSGASSEIRGLKSKIVPIAVAVVEDRFIVST
jgi:hypothetical protein